MLSDQLAAWQTVLQARLNLIQTSLDRLFLPAEEVPEEISKKKKSIPWWGILLIALGVLTLICCCVILRGPVGVVALGRVIGNIIGDLTGGAQ